MAFGLLYDFLMGQTIEAFDYFGAHFTKKDDEHGVMFRLYAPSAEDVSVIGDWNNWDYRKHKLTKIDDSGVFEIFIPGLTNYQSYKYHFRNARGAYVDKIDPFAFFSETRPGTASRLFNINGFAWHDKAFLKARDRNFDKPVSIYEMHVGGWQYKDDGSPFSYEEVADNIIPYLVGMGYTHVEFMPLAQYPFDGSWGYQATGFYSADSRYGNPFQLMSLIDRLHQAGIGVILDFAPVHFAIDNWALAKYDGTCLFEYSNKYTLSPWGSLQFDLGKDPVRSFLMSAINFYISYFHVDGIRLDAVSNMIFYNGDKNEGLNDGAIEFLKRLNGKIHLFHNDVMMIAEDSSDYPFVTKALEKGGLGFDYKWDLGWMNDTLKYYGLDPVYKKFDHNKLTFSMAYFYSDNFLLPFSHDEVVHGKGTILNKMWGDYYQKFAFIRNLYAYQFSHPGKKLTFMGNEFASFDEWDEKKSLPWDVKRFPLHNAISRLSADLNRIYRYHKAMYIHEYDPLTFSWLMVDNKDQSVFAFERHYEDEQLLFIFNMTPSFYPSYKLENVPFGEYEEILNTDKDVYGGANQYNGLPIVVKKDQPFDIILASFAALIFRKIKKD